MHVRIALLTHVVVIAMILTGTTTATAGVITTVNGVTSWTNDTDSTTYYFYTGSYNNAAVQPEGFTNALNLANEMVSDLNTQGTTDYVTYMFLFTKTPGPSRPASGSITAESVVNFTGDPNLYFRSNVTVDANNTASTGKTHLWASTTAPVPEPSTAIAMGLLGVVGFAGNRRRRRQVSAA